MMSVKNDRRREHRRDQRQKLKVYCGEIRRRSGDRRVFVTYDHCTLSPLAWHLDIYNHSPTGFAWGYEGSGPAQLALAILYDTTGDRELALALHQEFKRAHIAPLDPDKGWNLSESIVRAFVRNHPIGSE